MKKIIALLSVFTLLCVFSVNACASYSEFIIDDADLLTDSEEIQLAEKIDTINSTHSINVVIHTATDTDDKYVEDYADDFYDNGGYSADGLVFVISMAERDYYTSTCGTLVDSLPAYRIDSICEPVVPYLSSGEYYTAFELYLEQLDNYLSSDWYSGDIPYDDGYYAGDEYYGNNYYEDEYYYEDNYYPSSSGSLFDGVAAREIVLIIIAVIIAVVVTTILKNKMNTAVKKHDADDYVVKGSFNLETSRDAFIGSHTTRRALPQNNNNHGPRPGGGGGGGARVSSGGVRHGGSGGKF